MRALPLLTRARTVEIGAPPVLAALVAILAADAIAHWLVPSLGAWGVLDETAHVATAVIALAAVGTTFDRRLVLAVLVGAVALDVDHFPGVLGYHFLDHGTPRPYSHSLLTVAAVLAAAIALRGRARTVALAAWAALLLHFYRDLAEPHGPGVALLWPASSHAFTLAYPWYIAPVGALAAIALARRTRV